MRYAFADCVLDTERRELSRSGVPVKLEPRNYHVLTYLIQHAGRVVTQDELLENVWGSATLAGDPVARCINVIRKAVGDSRVTQQVIQTRSRHDYCLVAPVTVMAMESSTPTPLPLETPGTGAPLFLVPPVRKVSAQAQQQHGLDTGLVAARTQRVTADAQRCEARPEARSQKPENQAARRDTEHS